MNFKTTGILLALLIIVVGAAWLFVVPRGPSATDETAKPAPTAAEQEKDILSPKVESKDVVRLTIERPGKPKMVFTRAPKADKPDEMGNWTATEPLAVAVMPVDGFVATLTGLRARTHFEPGTAGGLSEADAGLSPPAATVTLATKDGKETKIEIGKKAAMSDETYVRIAGQKTVYAATRDLTSDVRKDFNDYREKRLSTLNANDAVRAEINTGDKSYVLTRGEDGTWVIDSPVKAYAQKEEVLGLLRKVTALRAQDFADDAPKSLDTYGLDHPYLTISLKTETKHQLPSTQPASDSQPAEPKFETITETQGFVIGGHADLKKENRYAKLADQPWVATVKQKDVEGLLPDLNKLRDPKITRIKEADATRIELTADGATATLEKSGNQWRGTGDLADLDSMAVKDLLQAFEDLTAIDYILEPGDLAQYGLDHPRSVVTVAVGGAVAPVTLQIGAETKSGRNAYVLRQGQPTVFVVSEAQADRLAVAPLSLRSRAILTADAANIRNVDLVRGPQHQVLAREGAQWKFVEPAGAPVDPESIRVLANDLSRLRARKVVAKGDDAKYGLDKPEVTIHMTVAPPAPPQSQPASAPASQSTSPPATQATSAPAAPPVEHVLRVGVKDKVAYCRIDDEPYVFELDETVFKVLNGELVDRKLFTFQPAEVVGVTIVAPGGTLEFARDGQDWKYVPDPFVKPIQSKVEDLVKDLAGLRVELYVEYQNADLAKAGLLNAPATVSIKLRGDKLINLKLEQEHPGELPRLGGWVEEKRSFRLKQADCEKLMRGLDYYLKADTKETKTPGEGDEDMGEPVPPPARPMPPRPVRPAHP